jgi:hypothetical protein
MNMFWTGVLAGMVVSAFAPGWVKGITTVVAVVFSGLVMRVSAHAPHHVHFAIPAWAFAWGGVAFGLWSWHYARKRGLDHLGVAEAKTRWERVRETSKWGF